MVLGGLSTKMSGKAGALPRPADMGGSEFLRELSRAPLSSDFTHLRQPTEYY
jgi:hypothetical protein